MSFRALICNENNTVHMRYAIITHAAARMVTTSARAVPSMISSCMFGVFRDRKQHTPRDWSESPPAEKKKNLFLKQKETLDLFFGASCHIKRAIR